MEDRETVNILLGLTGSVASIKAGEIVSSLKATNFCDRKVRIKVIVTEKAKHFLPKDWHTIGADEILTDEQEWKWTKRYRTLTSLEEEPFIIILL